MREETQTEVPGETKLEEEFGFKKAEKKETTEKCQGPSSQAQRKQ